MTRTVISESGIQSSVLARLRTVGGYFLRPIALLRDYRLADLRPDLVSGLTVAVIGLPQAMAYALIAELPPQVGLYAGIVGPIVGALWGSSSHLRTGPTNAASLLVLSTLIMAGMVPGTPDYIAAAGLLALMGGVFRLVMGLARLGALVSFVSDSVIVGFTAGAGALIFFNQLRHLFRLDLPSSPGLAQTIPNLMSHLDQSHLPSFLIGLATIAVILGLNRLNRKLPASLIAISLLTALVAVVGADRLDVRVIGELPRGLPPLARLPVDNLELVGRLGTGALALAAIGLVEAMSIARSIAGQTGQRLDANQEFVGQGLANIASGLFSGYACSGSFVRSMVSRNAGARTALSGVFAGLAILIIVLLFAPLATTIPLAGLAGVLILVALRLADWREIARIWRGGGGDRTIMVVTLLATLALPLQYAVLSGIMVSLGHYLLKTSAPRVRRVLPSGAFRHLSPQSIQPACPQLEIVDILGDIYFGAVDHVESEIRYRPGGARFLLIRMHSVENFDISGIHMLERVVRGYREIGGDLFLVKVQRPVRAVMKASGFSDLLGQDHFLDGDTAISYLFHRVLDPAICIYECPVRAFQECQNLPKRLEPGGLHLPLATSGGRPIPTMEPIVLWDAMHGQQAPLVIDVREPREFRRGHIPGAELVPLPSLLDDLAQVPADRPVVLVCRGGRRSGRATIILQEQGYPQVSALRGGMLAWEAANLLEAIE